MTVSTFMTLLTILSTANALITQGVKKTLDSEGCRYSSNVVAGIDAAIVGILGTACWMAATGTPISPSSIVFTILMAIAVWLTSMVGFDKVKQLIMQIGEAKW